MTNKNIARVLLAVGAVNPSLASQLLANLSGSAVKAVAVPSVKAVKAKAKLVPMSIDAACALNEGDHVVFESGFKKREGIVERVQLGHVDLSFVGGVKTFSAVKPGKRADGKFFAYITLKGEAKNFRHDRCYVAA